MLNVIWSAFFLVGFAAALIQALLGDVDIFSRVLTGLFDNISVVVRDTLVQVLTPEAMRGRVSAVNNVFIGSSNQLGAFESGVTAAMSLIHDLEK